MVVHPTAAGGFDAAADEYERSRPGYPQAALDLLTDRLRLGPGRRVLDLACGTGKLTRPLVATGAEVVAVEPVTGMRRVLRAALPDVDVRDGTAEAIPLADGAVDAVTVAQAFHWFDAPRALAEIARVLVPGGSLAVVFNTRDLDTDAQRAVDDLLRTHRGATPSWTDHRWRDALTAPERFGAPERFTWPHRQVVDEDGLVGRVASISFVATLDAPARADILTRTRDLFASLQRDGVVELVYETEIQLLTSHA